MRQPVTAERLRVVLRDYEVPSLPINALLSHTRLLSNKVRALVEFSAMQLNSRDFSFALPLLSAAGNAGRWSERSSFINPGVAPVVLLKLRERCIK
jgi:hypothetical protein